MRGPFGFSIVFLSWLAATPLGALESPTAAGPIGGTDLRSALMPPAGLYGGSVQGYAETIDFLDGEGRPIPALKDAGLSKAVIAPFFYYVPDVSVLGGSVGFGAILPAGGQCGRLVAATPRRCEPGLADLYAEVNWGRYFGTPRPSKDPGAYPILEGLAVMAGLGTVFPIGTYDASDPQSQVLSLGNNIWDFAPSLAVTYTTPAILGEGTEFSAKFYGNFYLENSVTRYQTGTLLNLDFAVTEHFGRWQAGVAGVYFVQVADDALRGVPFEPDGRRTDTLQMGGVLSYDMPEYASSVKVKALTSVFTYNTVSAWAVYTSWVRRF